MRVGVFGGAFDPVHYGHLILAEQCREQAALDQVWFVPAARHPFKSDPAGTPFERRTEMLRLAVAGNPSLQVNEIEKDRPGPSFMEDTLAELKRRHQEATLLLLLGITRLPEWWYMLYMASID